MAHGRRRTYQYHRPSLPSRRMAPMKTKSLIALAAVAFAAGKIAPAAAQAPHHPALQDKWSFGVGAFFPNTATQAQLTSNTTGVGTSIEFEDTFNMDRSKTVPVVYGRWRINERWRIDAEYF